MADLYAVAGPILRLLPPEAAHEATLWALRHRLVPAVRAADDPILKVKVWDREFSNPIGLAAGFDKNAEVMGAMLGLGFGFVEVGTVTPRPQRGNPRPRLFRLPKARAIINRLGFNSAGLAVVAGRLGAWREHPGRAGVVGANIGRNRDSPDDTADYEEGVRTLAPLADYLVINVSSPNTPGLTDLQDRDRLTALIKRTRAARDGTGAGTPLLIKIAPDLDERQRREVAEVAMTAGVDGLVVTNTTVARPPGLRGRRRGEAGGLSGRPLFALSTEVLKDMYRLTGGVLPLIGVGGVESGKDAYAKICAGASLVQLYTALVYHGPALVGRVRAELAECLRRDGFAAVGEAVGVELR